jgi:hypothetical protein
MDALVLENGFEIDIPEELIEYLNENKIKWQWVDTRFLFWKENRVSTVKYFSELPDNQLLICSTVFDGYQQLELFIQLLFKLKDKNFTFKIMHSFLCDDLIKFYEHYESSITPYTKEYDDSPKKREEFKQQMNNKFLEVLKSHNIYWIERFGDEILLKNIEDVKSNCFG